MYICVVCVYKKEKRSGSSSHCSARLKRTMEAGYEESPPREYEAPQGNNNVGKDRTIPELLAFHRIKTRLSRSWILSLLVTGLPSRFPVLTYSSTDSF